MVPDEPAAPEASARTTGRQVSAGAQAAPQLNWAEALRTGAIPLPAVSRGTYAAPAKGPRRRTAPSSPSPAPARFEIRHVGRQRFEATNVGGTTAEDALLEGTGEDRHLVSPVETRPKAVLPGAALAFSVLRVEGRSVSVLVTWQVGGTPTRAELPVA